MSDTERPVSAFRPARFARCLAAETAQALRFFSRLPVPALPWETDPHAAPDFARLPRVLPLAGLVVALPAALVLWLAARWGVPHLAAAGLAVAALAAATGGMHEDGLADTADGFGGGHTAERRLAIMADSRIGAFGAMALVIALLLRVALVAALLDRAGVAAAAGALLAAAAASRTAMSVPLWLLPSARPGGRSASVGRATGGAMLVSAAVSVLAALVLAPAAAGTARILGALALAAALSLAMTAWSRRMLGGQTGDVAGATQVVCEIAILLVLASV